jgi:hypothetical protein
LILHGLGKVECVIAMKGANDYAVDARTQMKRIERATTKWHALGGRASVFHEIHYYFICWTVVWKRLQVIKEKTAFASLAP